jgi:hypothetical protein
MTIIWFVISLVASAVFASDPALARVKHIKHEAPIHCIARPQTVSWSVILLNTRPKRNGCAPPVYSSGNNYVGQDPDPNIRFQLLRDPQTGYSPY